MLLTNTLPIQIYVPIEDLGGHWFLMVVASTEKALYHVDSFPEDLVVPDRHSRMRTVVFLLKAYLHYEKKTRHPPDQTNLPLNFSELCSL